MATGQGVGTLSFGTVGGKGSNTASVAITGLTTISATSKVESFFMGSDTSGTHTANDHQWADVFIDLTCGTPTAGVGFTIFGTAMQKMSGTFQVRWVFAD